MKQKPEQVPFDLGHDAAYAREDFRVSDCNRAALGFVDKWPDWPAPALIIHGPAASGKTHLARIWQVKSKAVILNEAKDGARAVVIDDAQKFIGDAAQEETLFHLYNMVKETGGHILMTASSPPREWKIVLPDLRSRLLAAPAVALDSPDDGLMEIVLAKMFSDRQIFVPQEVIAFILPRMERSFSAARELAGKIDQKALAEKRPVTIPLVRDLMQGQAGKLPL